MAMAIMYRQLQEAKNLRHLLTLFINLAIYLDLSIEVIMSIYKYNFIEHGYSYETMQSYVNDKDNLKTRSHGETY